MFSAGGLDVWLGECDVCLTGEFFGRLVLLDLFSVRLKVFLLELNVLLLFTELT